MTFGEYIREERTRRGLSGEQLAGKLGIDKNQIYLWETDKRGITLYNVLRLLEALDASVLIGAGGVIS